MMIQFQRSAYIAIVMAMAVLPSRSASAEEPLSFEDLLKEYKKLGLPMPPDSAKLVRFSTGWSGGGKDYVSVGFLLRAETEKEHAVILSGTREITIEHPAKAAEIKVDSEAPKDFLDKPLGLSDRVDTFSKNRDYLPLAIQCYSRKRTNLAEHFFKLSQQEDGASSKTQLIAEAWEYWKHRVATPKIERASVAERLHALIRLDASLDNEENRAFIKALDSALVPSKAKPGSIQALIDDLVDCGSESAEDYEKDVDRCSKIRQLGFEAVPALIGHLDDMRLTRLYRPAWFFNNFFEPAHHVTVGRLAGELLRQMAGLKATREWSDPPTKEQAEQWWAVARIIDEATYLSRAILPKENADENSDYSLVDQLRRRYPNRLAAIVRTVIEERRAIDTQDLAQAIAKSP